MASACYAPPGWTRQLEPRKVLGAQLHGLTCDMNELKLSGASRGVNNCPELALYIDTRRGPQSAGGAAS